VADGMGELGEEQAYDMAPRREGAASLPMPCFLARLAVRWKGISLQSWAKTGSFTPAGL